MANVSTEGRELHGLAEHAREKEQDFLKALNLLNEATIVYAKDHDYLGMSEAQASRFTTLKHLYEKTKDRNFFFLAITSAKSAIEIAENSAPKEALALAYLSLGKAYEEDDQFTNAIEPFKKAYEAINNWPPVLHNRPAVKADFLAHLSFVEYMVGDKSALTQLAQAIEELKTADEPAYTKDVWLSGAYMRMAKALGRGNPETKTYLDLAKAVIDANPDLKLRLGQWEKLAKELL